MGPPIPTNAGPTYEPLHFWFLGLLTAPYYTLTQGIGLNFADSYTFLFVTLWLAMVMVAHRLNGASGAIASTVIVVFSPVLWFVNKAHTEFLTVCCLTLGVILIDRGFLLWTALVISIAATQNPALSPIVVLVLGCWLYSRRWGPYSLTDILLCMATVFLTVLAPGYYFARHGVISPLTAAGYSGLEFVTLKRVVSLFIDPDIGLYPNWPLGLLLVLGGAVALVRKDVIALIVRKIQEKPFLFLSAGVFIVLMTLAQASQPNFNGGGTVHVSRYALWYIPLHYPLVLYGLRRASLLSRAGVPLHRKIAAAMLAFLLIVAIYFNVTCFAPQRAEAFLEHSRFANLVYDHFPAAFDPTPEVFIARTGHTINGVKRGTRQIDPGTEFGEGIWAFGTPSCRKVYVLAGMLSRADATKRPYGCVSMVDNGKLLTAAKAHGGDSDFYLNLPESQITGNYSLLAIGRQVVFSSPEAVQYLGEGWSGAEAGFRWTDGPLARVGFSVSKEDLEKLGGHRLVLRLDAAGMTLQAPVQVAQVVVNGKAGGVYSWRGSERPLTDIPVIPDHMGNVVTEFHIQYPLRKAAPSDTRALGLMCFSMQLLLL